MDKSQIRVTRTHTEAGHSYRPRIYRVVEKVSNHDREVTAKVAARLVDVGAARWGDK